MHSSFQACFLSAMLVSAMGAIRVHGASFTRVPALDESPGILLVSALSADGTTVVGYTTIGGVGVPFRWTHADGTLIVGGPSPRGASCTASAVSADGRIIAGCADMGRSVPWGRKAEPTAAADPVRWNLGAGVTPLGLLPKPGSNYTVTDMSADGAIIIGSGSTDQKGSRSRQSGFIWDERTGLRAFPEVRRGVIHGTNERIRSDAIISPEAISEDGSTIVGDYIVGAGLGVVHLGFVWSAEAGFESVGGLSGKDWPHSSARAVSADGSVVAGTVFRQRGSGLFVPCKQTGCAYRWTRSGGMRALDVLPGTIWDSGEVASQAIGLSGDGRIAVGYCQTTSGIQLAVWDEAGSVRALTDLLREAGVSLEGFRLTYPAALSSDGRRVAGDGVSTAGMHEGWVVDLSGTALFP